MSKYFVINMLLFFYSVSFGQKINLDKDSLVIYEKDSLIISNSGTNILHIFLMKPALSAIGYDVEVIKSDTSFGFFLHEHENELGNFELPPFDSAKFIFYEPDLCIVCKKTSTSEYFEDTLIVISNSIEDDTTKIFISGNGHPSSIEQINNNFLPNSFSLEQNYPNPFNPSTIIEYSLSKADNVRLELFNTLGEKISTLFSGYQSSGFYRYTFNARNISSGIYYYTLFVNGYKETRKMMYLK